MPTPPTRSRAIDSFDLQPGRVLGGRYIVESLLGAGWEGEVYKVTERRTGASRAAKVFFPQRNKDDKALTFYARKLEQLRNCPVVIAYHHSETFRFRGEAMTALISEFVDGIILERFIQMQRGRRLPGFEALHLLHALACGIEQIHRQNEYHGDLHVGNVLVSRRGIGFDLKLVDLYDLGRPTAANKREDVAALARLLYDMLGGQKRYASLRPELKYICAGLKRTILDRRFPTARDLRLHLEEFEWSAPA